MEERSIPARQGFEDDRGSDRDPGVTAGDRSVLDDDVRLGRAAEREALPANERMDADARLAAHQQRGNRVGRSCRRRVGRYPGGVVIATRLERHAVDGIVARPFIVHAARVPPAPTRQGAAGLATSSS
jgi:hypothetical protein